MSKVSEDVIDQIWNKKSALVPISELCSEYKISKATLFRLLKKRSKQTQLPFPSGRTLTDDGVLQIVAEWNSGLSQTDIAKHYNVSQSMISQIIHRKTRTEVTKNVWIRGDHPQQTADVSVVYHVG